MYHFSTCVLVTRVSFMAATVALEMCVCVTVCCGIQHVLSTPVDLLFPMELIKVLTALEPVVGEWYMLGLHLCLSDSVVDTIERDYHTTPERKKRMVQRWMSAPQLCPSWCSLVKALREVGLNTAAGEIAKKHSKCFVKPSTLEHFLLLSQPVLMKLSKLQATAF